MFASVLSLLLALASVAGWIDCRRADRLRPGLGRFTRSDRFPSYACFSHDGRLTLARVPPPAAADSQTRADAAALVATLRNSDIEFIGIFNRGDHMLPGGSVPLRTWGAPSVVRTVVGSRADPFKRSAELRSAALPGLILALNRPESFLAAHVLLTEAFEASSYSIDDSFLVWGHQTPAWAWTEAPDSDWVEQQPVHGVARGTYFGLHFTLRMPGGLKDPRFWDGKELACPVSVDGAQMPALREQWHRRLDVPVASARWPVLALMFLALPALHGAWFLRRAHQARLAGRQHLCRRCGYDLRASVDRCPECGTPIPGGRVALV